MTDRIVESKKIAWHHISQVSDADIEMLQKQYKFHSLDYEDVLSDAPLSKLDIYKHYLFLIFHLPTINEENGHVYGKALFVFLSQGVLVTISHKPHKVIDTFHERMQNSPKFCASVMNKGVGYLLYRILSEGFRDSMHIVKELVSEVSRLEETIEHKYEKKITVDLGHARRNALFLRHIVDPQRNILTTLSSTKRTFLEEEQNIYFDDLHDVLDTISLTSDNLKHIVDGLFDINETLISHKTNEVITLLTIVSAALMVPTLISGFYGMNVDWLPYAFDPRFVSSLFVIGVVSMFVIIFIVLRRPEG